MKHTPAPWIIQDTNVQTKDGFAIADSAVDYSSIESKEEHVANIKLIAAAPELLEKLKVASDLIGHIADSYEVNKADLNKNWHEILNLINKAEGK